MKALLISIKPKWCALMMNGYKTIEVRTSKALAKAIQKLIDENGYAEIYVYCTKDGELFYDPITEKWLSFKSRNIKKVHRLSNGVVKFKFRCYKVEEIEDVYSQENEFGGLCESYGTKTLKTKSLLNRAQLNYLELADYLKDYTPFGYAIHISNLEIFDKPKELGEFMPAKWDKCGVKDKNGLYQCKKCPYGDKSLPACNYKSLTKAPQNYMFIEVEE